MHNQVLPALSRRPRLALALLGLLLLASPLTAQEGAATSSIRFEIETITVEGAEKISPAIVVSESLLEEGRSYTESELRDARYRIVRLHFVLDASFALRRGSARGLYELVITVEETRRWFFGVDLDLTRWAEPISFTGLGTDDVASATGGLAGRRFSVGRYGVFFLALGGEDGTIQLGFNQYNLFGRSILLGVSYSFSDCEGEAESEEERGGSCRTDLYELGLDPTFSTWSAEGSSHRFRLDLGVPIRGNQSVRFAGSFRSTDFGFRRQVYRPQPFGFYDFENRRETRVFPSRGSVLEAGLNFNALNAELRSVTPFGRPPDIETSMDSRELGALVTGAHYWPVTRSQTLSAKAVLFLGRSSVENVPSESRTLLTGDLDVVRGSLGVGYGKFLRRSRVGSRWRDLRWESDAELLYGGTSPDFSQPQNPVSGFRVGTGIKFRNTWGVFQIKFSYLDLEGR